jgi:hypothetical protein
MRRAGALESVAGVGLHDHVCRVFDDDDDRAAAAAALIASGALAIMPLAPLYGSAGGLAGPPLLARYAEAAERALADGSTSLRVAADLTPLVADSGAGEAQARREREGVGTDDAAPALRDPGCARAVWRRRPVLG